MREIRITYDGKIARPLDNVVWRFCFTSRGCSASTLPFKEIPMIENTQPIIETLPDWLQFELLPIPDRKRVTGVKQIGDEVASEFHEVDINGKLAMRLGYIASSAWFNFQESTRPTTGFYLKQKFIGCTYSENTRFRSVMFTFRTATD